MTTSNRVNAVAAGAAAFYAMPNCVSTEHKIAISTVAAASVFAAPESQQLTVRTGLSLGLGLITACKLMPESTTLEGITMTALIAGGGAFLGLMQVDQIAHSIFNQTATTTNRQPAAPNGPPLAQRPIGTAHVMPAEPVQTVVGGPFTVNEQAAMANGQRVPVGNRQNDQGPFSGVPQRQHGFTSTGPQTVAQAQRPRAPVGQG